MADISKEIKNFREAVHGEEVRGSMISLAEKVNAEVENNTTVANNAASNANAAAEKANNAAGGADSVIAMASNAANNANTAAADANAARNEILTRLENGEFKGEKGEKGDTGPTGESGVMALTSGMFSLALDPETGNLYAYYPEGGVPPKFDYDPVTGNLYYVTEEE